METVSVAARDKRRVKMLYAMEVNGSVLEQDLDLLLRVPFRFVDDLDRKLLARRLVHRLLTRRESPGAQHHLADRVLGEDRRRLDLHPVNRVSHRIVSNHPMTLSKRMGTK